MKRQEASRREAAMSPLILAEAFLKLHDLAAMQAAMYETEVVEIRQTGAAREIANGNTAVSARTEQQAASLDLQPWDRIGTVAARSLLIKRGFSCVGSASIAS
jgi:hypothetical protein